MNASSARLRARHALRRRPAGRAPERAGDARAGRAGGARPPPRRGRAAADRGGQLRRAASACRRWPARRRSSPRSATVEAELSGLVLNERGWERLAATRARPRQRHARRDRDVQPAERQRDRWRRRPRASSGSSPSPTGRRRATISVAFGCPFEGDVDPGVVADLAERLVAAGAGEVVLADTIGVATPGPVRRLRRARLDPRRPGRRPLPRHAPHRRRLRLGGGRGRSAPSSTPRSAASAAARSRRARPATSPPRTCSTSSTARASRPASTSTR